MKVISSDHTAKFPNFYFTYLFILNPILNQGYSDPFSFSPLKIRFHWLSWIHFFPFTVSHCFILLPGYFIFSQPVSPCTFSSEHSSHVLP